MSDIRDAYNQAALKYREKYDKIPVRVEDVDVALNFIDSELPRVVEIGCAYGREASYILSKTTDYIGVDISDVYIEMARKELPGVTFVQADVMDYDWPGNIDVIYAFASLLHLNKNEMMTVVRSAAKSLKSGGVFFLSLKRGHRYLEKLIDDGHSKRLFYYYTRDTINDLTPNTLAEVYYAEQNLKEPWFTMILQKS
ncbi:MAG TPA: class I SAM-dependent methyltransferase [Candidatus Paceibacterota bacterium]|nr:class I SAM-dependent methyltransferase [Candidatus Paceibacterota bacterium]